MSEWWTYGLADFLLFSPRTYFRLVELYNQAVWPWHLLGLLAGLALLALHLRPGPAGDRAIPLLLAAAWLWVTWAWFAERYATINWAAIYLAVAFAAEAVLLLVLAAIGHRRQPAGPLRWIGLALLMFGVLGQPAMAPLSGRGSGQLELFGVMPDPTAVATLGVLLAGWGWLGRAALAIPVLWCLASGATLAAMEQPDAWVAPLAALVAISAAIAVSLRSVGAGADPAARPGPPGG